MDTMRVVMIIMQGQPPGENNDSGEISPHAIEKENNDSLKMQGKRDFACKAGLLPDRCNDGMCLKPQ